MVKGPVSNRRISRRKMRQAMLIGGAVIILVIVAVSAWSLLNKAAESREQSRLKDMQNVAKAVAVATAKNMAVYRQQLQSAAKAAAVMQALSNADAAAMQLQAEQQVANFASALKLRLFIPGEFLRDSSGKPPMGFRSIGLLEQAAESGIAAKAEVHFYGSPEQHVVIIEPVFDQAGKLIGLLHLSLQVEIFEQLLKLADNQAYAELQQAGTSKKLILASQGTKSVKKGEGVAQPVKNTYWQLVYWPPAGIMQTGSGGGKLLLIIIAVVVLLVGVVVFLVKRQAVMPGANAKDNVFYAGAVEAIMQGAHPGMEKLVPNLPDVGNQRSIMPVSQGMVGEDITRISGVSEVKKAATEESKHAAAPLETNVAAAVGSIDAGIFRAYDIRGLVDKNLTADVVNKIGLAIGSEAASRGEQGIIVARDGRNSSPALSKSLIKGLRDSGRDVIDIGMVPTPLLYFATHYLEANSGVMLTGSHNGPEYNGLKIVLSGETLAEGAIQSLYQRVLAEDFESGQGSLHTADIAADYVRRISDDVPVALAGALKIVTDAGNGVAGAIAPQVLRALGHEVVELFCDVDGNFPNHHPDPTQPENLQALIEKVKSEQADIGFAFDGDGDRLGVVDNSGNIIWADRQLMLFAKDVLSRNQGASIIYDVKCSRYLKAIIEASGGKAEMWRTGHSLIKARMKDVDAPLAGEMSGHIFFKERWYGFDDAIYSAARMVEIIINTKISTAELFAQMPAGVSTPELKVALAEKHHKTVMAKLKEKMDFANAEVIDIDGIRVEFEDGWGLIRPSNTTPCLVLRFEAESDAALKRIQAEFRRLLESVNPELIF